jgi:hypothetical protein
MYYTRTIHFLFRIKYKTLNTEDITGTHCTEYMPMGMSAFIQVNTTYNKTKCVTSETTAAQYLTNLSLFAQGFNFRHGSIRVYT